MLNRGLTCIFNFLSTEILTINSSDQVYNRKMLKYTLILYCSFCLSFGDKNRVTSLLYQVLIKPIGKLSLLFFRGGGGGGCYLNFSKHRLHRCPTEEADMTRMEQPPTTTPPHSPEKKKYIHEIDACFAAFLQYHRTLCLSCRNHFIICHSRYVLLLILYVHLFKIARETRSVLFRSALLDCF